LGKSPFRNSIDQTATDLIVTFEDRDLVTLAPQIMSCQQSSRSCTNNRYALSPLWRHIEQVLRFTRFPLREKALDVTNPDRFIIIHPLAMKLARMITDVSQDTRERKFFPDLLERLPKPAFLGKLNVCTSIHMKRAPGHTIRRTLPAAGLENLPGCNHVPWLIGWTVRRFRIPEPFCRLRHQ